MFPNWFMSENLLLLGLLATLGFTPSYQNEITNQSSTERNSISVQDDAARKIFTTADPEQNSNLNENFPTVEQISPVGFSLQRFFWYARQIVENRFGRFHPNFIHDRRGRRHGNGQRTRDASEIFGYDQVREGFGNKQYQQPKETNEDLNTEGSEVFNNFVEIGTEQPFGNNGGVLQILFGGRNGGSDGQLGSGRFIKWIMQLISRMSQSGGVFGQGQPGGNGEFERFGQRNRRGRGNNIGPFGQGHGRVRGRFGSFGQGSDGYDGVGSFGFIGRGNGRGRGRGRFGFNGHRQNGEGGENGSFGSFEQGENNDSGLF